MKFIAPLFAGLLFLAACGMKPGPEQVLSSYLKALEEGNYDKAYTYIATADKAYIPQAAYSKSMELSNVFSNLLSMPNANYFIEQVEVAEAGGQAESASAVVQVTRPDVAQVMDQRLQNATAEMLGQESPGAGSDTPPDKEALANAPTVTESIVYTMVKEEDGWKVRLQE